MYLFLNSGSWTRDAVIHNPFIYLDETGNYLLKWNPSGHIISKKYWENGSVTFFL
jgi:hypothetical protein